MTGNFDLLETIERINREHEERDRIAKKYHVNAIAILSRIPRDIDGRLIIEPGSKEEKAYNELYERRINNCERKHYIAENPYSEISVAMPCYTQGCSNCIYKSN